MENEIIVKEDSQATKQDALGSEFREATMMIQSGLLPSRFKTPQQVMTAYRFAKETGLQPLTAMRQMAVINGTPSFYGDLPLSIVLNSGKLESIDEYLITQEYTRISLENKNLHEEPWACVCRVKRKGDPEVCERFFSVKDAHNAGLGKSIVWKSYLARMLTYRARSQALKDKFSDCLNGVAIAEYDFNVTENEDKSEVVSEVSDINERFK